MSYGYDEDDELMDFDPFEDNWQIIIDESIIGVFFTKLEAIETLIDELISLNDDKDILNLTDYDNTDDMLYDLTNMDSESFYIIINKIIDEINIKFDIKLVCLNDDEPTFGEL
jgi:hypothetical protein